MPERNNLVPHTRARPKHYSRAQSLKQCMAALAMLMASAGVSAGAISTYGDLAAYQGALGTAAETVEEFTLTYHFPISTGMLNSATDLVVPYGSPILPGDIRPGVTYSTPVGSGSFFNIDADGGFVGGFLDGLNDDDPNRLLTVAFDSPARAFGFDTNGLMGTAFDITINFAGAPAYSGSFAVSAGTALQFFGFRSSLQDITTAVIHGNGGGAAFALDNFRFSDGDGSSNGASASGNSSSSDSGGEPGPGFDNFNDIGATAIPEPATLALLGLGLAGLGVSRRKR